MSSEIQNVSCINTKPNLCVTTESLWDKYSTKKLKIRTYLPWSGGWGGGFVSKGAQDRNRVLTLNYDRIMLKEEGALAVIVCDVSSEVAQKLHSILIRVVFIVS